MMILMGLFHHENSTENSAETNISKVSDKHLLPNANVSFRPDLQQFQQGMVHNFCLCCSVEFVSADLDLGFAVKLKNSQNI